MAILVTGATSLVADGAYKEGWTFVARFSLGQTGDMKNHGAPIAKLEFLMMKFGDTPFLVMLLDRVTA